MGQHHHNMEGMMPQTPVSIPATGKVVLLSHYGRLDYQIEMALKLRGNYMIHMSLSLDELLREAIWQSTQPNTAVLLFCEPVMTMEFAVRTSRAFYYTYDRDLYHADGSTRAKSPELMATPNRHIVIRSPNQELTDEQANTLHRFVHNYDETSWADVEEAAVSYLRRGKVAIVCDFPDAVRVAAEQRSFGFFDGDALRLVSFDGQRVAINRVGLK